MASMCDTCLTMGRVHAEPPNFGRRSSPKTIFHQQRLNYIRTVISIYFHSSFIANNSIFPLPFPSLNTFQSPLFLLFTTSQCGGGSSVVGPRHALVLRLSRSGRRCVMKYAFSSLAHQSNIITHYCHRHHGQKFAAAGCFVYTESAFSIFQSCPSHIAPRTTICTMDEPNNRKTASQNQIHIAVTKIFEALALGVKCRCLGA